MILMLHRCIIPQLHATMAYHVHPMHTPVWCALNRVQLKYTKPNSVLQQYKTTAIVYLRATQHGTSCLLKYNLCSSSLQCGAIVDTSEFTFTLLGWVCMSKNHIHISVGEQLWMWKWMGAWSKQLRCMAQLEGCIVQLEWCMVLPEFKECMHGHSARWRVSGQWAWCSCTIMACMTPFNCDCCSQPWRMEACSMMIARRVADVGAPQTQRVHHVCVCEQGCTTSTWSGGRQRCCTDVSYCGWLWIWHTMPTLCAGQGTILCGVH